MKNDTMQPRSRTPRRRRALLLGGGLCALTVTAIPLTTPWFENVFSTETMSLSDALKILESAEDEPEHRVVMAQIQATHKAIKIINLLKASAKQQPKTGENVHHLLVNIARRAGD